MRRAPQDGRLEEINKVRAGGCELREGRGEAVGRAAPSCPEVAAGVPSEEVAGAGWERCVRWFSIPCGYGAALRAGHSTVPWVLCAACCEALLGRAPQQPWELLFLNLLSSF